MIPPPVAANSVDAAALADQLVRARVVPSDRLADLLADFPGGGPAALAEFLVARKVLTPFQADRALAGEARLLAQGPYRLTDLHRQGSFGPVLRGEKGGTAFAIRVLPLRSLWQARQAKLLARTLSSVPLHPGVLPLVDADSAGGYHYLVWPLTSGESLGDLVRAAGPFHPDKAAVLLAHLAAALAACHTRQVVHGLLTPAAVAIGVRDEPRLLDLGAGTLLARDLAAEEPLLDTLSGTTAVAGALPYAAPEWVTDPTRPTPAGDQYALGAVGYFVLTGRPPARSGVSLAEANPEVPRDLAAAVDRLLRLDPADRFSGMDEVREVFAELAGHPVWPDPDDGGVPTPRSGQGATSDRTGLSKQGGIISWGGGGTIPTQIPARDDSDASVEFDLPPPEPEPAVVAVPVRSSAARGGSAAAGPPGGSPAARPVTPAPVRAGRLIGAVGAAGNLPPLPVLPAVPLLPAAPIRAGGGTGPAAPLPAPPETPRSAPVLWKKVKRKVLFWQTPTDAIQVGVFGPRVVAPGQTPRLTVYLYPPTAAESVGTLARAFYQEAVLLATGLLASEVVRGAELAVHVAVANVQAMKPLAEIAWRGQPDRLTFDLVVPWETPNGPSLGVVSVGHQDVRIGKVEFSLPIFDGTD